MEAWKGEPPGLVAQPRPEQAVVRRRQVKEQARAQPEAVLGRLPEAERAAAELPEPAAVGVPQKRVAVASQPEGEARREEQARRQAAAEAGARLDCPLASARMAPPGKPAARFFSSAAQGKPPRQEQPAPQEAAREARWGRQAVGRAGQPQEAPQGERAAVVSFPSASQRILFSLPLVGTEAAVVLFPPEVQSQAQLCPKPPLLAVSVRVQARTAAAAISRPPQAAWEEVLQAQETKAAGQAKQWAFPRKAGARRQGLLARDLAAAAVVQAAGAEREVPQPERKPEQGRSRRQQARLFPRVREKAQPGRSRLLLRSSRRQMPVAAREPPFSPAASTVSTTSTAPAWAMAGLVALPVRREVPDQQGALQAKAA